MAKQRGSISAVVVCLAMSAVALTGLVFDGGNIVNTYSQLSDLAENTGRVGAQHISGIRAGDPYINKAEAIPAMTQFANGCRCSMNFSFENSTVTVTMSRRVTIRVLGILGFSHRSVGVSRVVQLVDG